ncbi:MAG: FAD-binding oxidoreductase [Proteobacteria bacterium]|nr:FAD-binding oxidoreductase [Pseudomonadota bacterium]
MKMSRREILAGGCALAVQARAGDVSAQQRLVMNDASRLNPTPLFRHFYVRSDEADFVAALRRELKEAAAVRRSVALGAARHSMGGQSLIRNGVAMTFDIDQCELDRTARIYRVHAGTRWHQVIAHLDPAGFSPAVMQSNSDFGVGATFSVNAHGWPTPYGPFGSTVRSIRLMLADGTILTCSRNANAELFALAMGGYGLVGVILDLEVEMTDNMLLQPRFEAMPAGEFAKRFIAASHDPAVPMIYGRLNVERERFFSEALLVSWRKEPTPAGGLPPPARKGALTGLSRQVYRAQVGREWGKSLRWHVERSIAPMLANGTASRNRLMNEPALNLANRDQRRVDILHEYFVSPDRFNEFLEGCRRIIPKAIAEFLNVTLRHVKRDPTSMLSFATTDRIAAVMSFSQRIDADGETDMIKVTEALIDLVGSIGGSFYLPYRLHARPDQFARIYPDAQRFSQRKRHYDPGLLFQNTMWNTYFNF